MNFAVVEYTYKRYENTSVDTNSIGILYGRETLSLFQTFHLLSAYIRSL